jgi:segregation and condensation protein B
MELIEVQRILEAALLCADRPLSMREMKALFDEAVDSGALRHCLAAIQDDWSDRQVELVEVSTGWRFQSRPAVRRFLDRLHPEKPPRYSRAVMETLAIIAYRQPVTRGDVEDIRGVTVATPIVKQLEERGWIEVIGHREAPGRPALYATTRHFLDDLGLSGLHELPPLDTSALGQPRTLGMQDDLLVETAQGLLALDVPLLEPAAPDGLSADAPQASALPTLPESET